MDKYTIFSGGQIENLNINRVLFILIITFLGIFIREKEKSINLL